MENLITKTFFSVCFNLIATEQKIPYDLYVNSSSLEDKERFVKIFKANEFLTKKDLATFKDKHYQLYVLESQRLSYLKTLFVDKKDFEKVSILKNSAIKHLETLFSNKDKSGLTREIMSQTLIGCNDLVKCIVDVLNNHNVDSLQELIGSLSFHDFYTYDHSVNVSMYTVLLFKAIYPDATQEEVITAGISGLLHDLGKIKISTEILNGTSHKLSDSAYTEIKKHPQYGYDLLKGIKIGYKEGVNPYVVSKTILEHHENFNGTGYPNKVQGEDIHIMARICAVADFFDATTTKRSYSQPLAIPDALALMAKHVGTKLDPQVFNHFVNLTDNFDKKLISTIEVDKNFDPCDGTLAQCMCDDETMGVGQPDFGDILLIGKDKQEFKSILEKNQPNIIFKKSSTKTAS